MTVAEILEELPTLKPEERLLVWERLNELELGDADETPEMLAAIDEAERSPRSEDLSAEEVQANLEKWLRTP